MSSAPEQVSTDCDGACQMKLASGCLINIIVCGITPDSVFKQTRSVTDQILMISVSAT